MVPLHCTDTIALLCSASVCFPQFSFWVLYAILLLGASHNFASGCFPQFFFWVLPTILLGFGQKAGAASAGSTIPRLPSRKTAKPAFPPLRQSPSLSSPFFLAIVFPLFPLVCSSSPHAARSQDFCLCKSAKTHTACVTGWGTVQNQPSLQLISTLSSFCPFTKNPLFIIIIIMIVYSDGNLGGNLLL